MDGPAPRHDPTHLQLPVEAVKIHLDLALSIMQKNDGINKEDWVWFDRYVKMMSEESNAEVIKRSP